MNKLKIITMALLPITTIGTTIGIASCSSTTTTITKPSLEDIKVSLYHEISKDKWVWGEFKLSQVDYVTFGLYDTGAANTLRYTYSIKLKGDLTHAMQIYGVNTYNDCKASYENYKTAMLYWLMNNNK